MLQKVCRGVSAYRGCHAVPLLVLDDTRVVALMDCSTRARPVLPSLAQVDPHRVGREVRASWRRTSLLRLVPWAGRMRLVLSLGRRGLAAHRLLELWVRGRLQQ
eukprot:scaffold85949_cov33-Tisochrysis_lutea.AAC.4